MQNKQYSSGKVVNNLCNFSRKNCLLNCVQNTNLINLSSKLCNNRLLNTFYPLSLYNYFHNIKIQFSSVVASLYTVPTDIYNYYNKVFNYIIVKRSNNEIRN
jgi:hypothetical protein